MSFGFAIGDFLVLTQLAWNVVQNSRKACGAHAALTHEVTCLHVVLGRLQVEIQTATSPINRMTESDGRRNELNTIIGGCNRVLRVLDQVLQKYNGLSDKTRRTTKLWQRIRFGNGEMKDLDGIKRELTTYTFAITLFLNLLSLGSQGRVEQHMETHSVELRELRHSLNWITASLQAGSNNREESILTSYADDDRKIWKEFRRELLSEGFSSKTLSRHKSLIKDYVLELGARGALDAPGIPEPIVVEDKELEGIENGVPLDTPEPYDLSSEMDAVAPTPNTFPNSPSHPNEGSEDIAQYLPENSRISVYVSDSHPSSVLDLSTLSGTVESFPSILDLDDSVTLYAPEIEGNSGFITGAEEPSSPSQHGDEARLHIIVNKSQPIASATNSAEVKSNIISLAATVEELEDEDFIAATHPNFGDSSLREETDIPSPIEIDGAPVSRVPDCDAPATEIKNTERRFVLLDPEFPSYSNCAKSSGDQSSIIEQQDCLDWSGQAQDSGSSCASGWSRACHGGLTDDGWSSYSSMSKTAKTSEMSRKSSYSFKTQNILTWRNLTAVLCHTIDVSPSWTAEAGGLHESENSHTAHPSNDSDNLCDSETASRNLRSAIRDSSRPDLAARSDRIATERDARRYRIPFVYDLKNWDPRRTPIILLRKVYDAESVGILLHQWASSHHGPEITDNAAYLHRLLADLVGKVEAAREHWRVGNIEDSDMDDIAKSSEILVSRLKHLLTFATKSNRHGLRWPAEFKLVETVFGHTRQSQETQALLSSLRFWNMRFDACWAHDIAHRY